MQMFHNSTRITSVTMSAATRNECPLKKQLKDIDDQLKELKITVKNHSENPRLNRKPIADLVIPNKLFLLWDRKTILQRRLSACVSKHYDMAQSCIQGRKIILEKTALVEKRLKKEASRFLKFYRSKKIGTVQRNNMLVCDTSMTIFKDEVNDQSEEYSGKDYSELGDRQQRRRKAQIKSDIQHLSDSIHSIGLTVESVQLRDVNNNTSFNIKLAPSDTAAEPNGVEEETHVPEICYLLLKYGVSMKFYHELSMECTDLPRSYKVKEFKQALPIPKIFPSPGMFQGAQFDFKELLKKLAKEEIEAHSKFYEAKQSLMIKISGDGAKYNKSSTFCLLSFAFIRRHTTVDISSTSVSSDDGVNNESGLSSADVHTIAVIKAPENYDNIKEGFRDVIATVNSYIKNPKITICGIDYELKFALCADYKFLLTVMGMKQANSSHSCIWCEVKDEERHDMELKFPKRTLQSIKRNGAKSELGCIKAPLFDIDISNVIADELHLLLRILDVLVQGLIDTAVAHDHHTTRRVKAPDGPMVKNLTSTIKSCGVNFYVWEDRKGVGKALQWPSLMGTEKKKILKSLPSKISDKCQPGNLVNKLVKLWNDFDGIYSTISSRAPTSHHDLHERGKEWISLFLDIGKEPISDGYQPVRITPYMHIMVFHVPDMIDMHGNVKQFSCQGVEKNNDDAKRTFFRSSNKWDAPYDILATEHRIHQLKGRKRTSHDYDNITNEDYFKNGGIQESRKKRQRISHQNLDEVSFEL